MKNQGVQILPNFKEIQMSGSVQLSCKCPALLQRVQFGLPEVRSAIFFNIKIDTLFG